MIRRVLVCRGAVQGVGFRPAVHRLATAHGLRGEVRNDGEGATIEIEGEPVAVARFRRDLPGALPPLASLEELEEREEELHGFDDFEVRPSTLGAREHARLPADAALCPACRAELDDPDDRRARYPFTTCTDCGPRFTLAHALPYDRERTSMAPFALCPECAAEYADPESRRFHAEPICCPICGPPLRLVRPDGTELERDASALAAARAALAAGLVVAVKGLGGFQLACRADHAVAIERLRASKCRPTKPFAVMARDLDTARGLVALTAADERLLSGPRGPILLAPRRRPSPVVDAVAPGIDDLGVLLPTTPLHVELFRGLACDALVMTSGNRGDEPICRTDAEALAALGSLADVALLHEREVVRRADDSVARTTAAGPVLLRRSRGWVPEPVPLPARAPRPALALGGHLQTTACLAVGDQAFPSQHVGDLDTDGARAFLREAAEGLEELFEARAATIVVDEHPDYPSAWLGERLAAERGARVLRVQHHLAHAAAVLAEHGRFPSPGERVLALVLDGTGYGPDGTAWGAECLLLAGDLCWWRLGGGAPLPLVGGERAVREPWRVACAALALRGEMGLLGDLPLSAAVPVSRLAAVATLAKSGAWPRARGAGRVFEAAGALLGGCAENGWEGEAAARLEALATRAESTVEPWPEVALNGAELPGADILVSAARRAAAGESLTRVALGVHVTYAHLAARLARRSAPDGVALVALGGGCLVNRLLSERLCAELERLGLEPLLPRALPPGDGGLSYGQAALATVALARDTEPSFRGGL